LVLIDDSGLTNTINKTMPEFGYYSNIPGETENYLPHLCTNKPRSCSQALSTHKWWNAEQDKEEG